MSKKVTFLMCSPRGEESASYSLGLYLTNLLKEEGSTIDYFENYKTLKKSEKVEEMIESIDKSDIIIFSTPLYIDSAPHMTIRLMDTITKAKEEDKIGEKERMFLTISCAGFLEFYHNNISLKIYEQFAQQNGFTWAGGLPIGAAGTYIAYSITELIEMIKPLPKEDPRHKIYGEPAIILDEVIKSTVKYLIKGEKVPKDELERLEFIPMPLESYVEGGNSNWIGWAERIETVDKLRDKPYEQK